MDSYNEMLKSEISSFRELGHKFLNKEVSVGDFKGASGGMGVYAQRGGQNFMIRLRTPSGIIPLKHMKLISLQINIILNSFILLQDRLYSFMTLELMMFVILWKHQSTTVYILVAVEEISQETYLFQ